jgi:hypothetical protein
MPIKRGEAIRIDIDGPLSRSSRGRRRATTASTEHRPTFNEAPDQS